MPDLSTFFAKGQAGLIPVLLFFLIPVIPLSAEDNKTSEEKIPPAEKEYMGRPIAQTMHWLAADWLTRTEREREEASSVMLTALKLKPGMVVCDLGCGIGYHALPMAKEVAPDGKILAVDIQPEMLRMLNSRAKHAGLTNIETIKGSLTNPNLPDEAVDLILIVDAYHEFSHPVEMLKAIHKSLKPDGRVVLVEFRAEDRTVPIKPEHKMAKKQVIKELEANQFKLDESFDKLPWQHMLFFKKAAPKK